MYLAMACFQWWPTAFMKKCMVSGNVEVMGMAANNLYWRGNFPARKQRRHTTGSGVRGEGGGGCV
jgi:hypothetical protein